MFWDRFPNWKKAELEWDQKAESLKNSHPLKMLNTLPKMAGIAEKGIKRKGLFYLLSHADKRFWRYFFKHPLRYTARLFWSYFKGKSYVRDADFFLYGFSTPDEFVKKLSDPKSLFVLGFSYCHKPFECPSGRFTDQCIHDPDHPTCRQCFIGKCTNAAPRDTILLWIPTIHYIGEKMFALKEAYPTKNPLFLITACEMSLEMFGDWGYMASLEGIGVRLDGRICNTMKAFELSEKGVKPGLTVVLQESQKRILDLLLAARERR